MSRLTVDDVYAHIHSVCFRTGPPGRVGAEAEWLVHDRSRPADHVPLDRLRAAMDTAGPLPAGSRITFEPGGQLELSTVPGDGVQAACTALAADVSHVRRHLAPAGLSLTGGGVDPARPPLLQLRSPRYQCMSTYFGVRGLAPMCSTASMQVCLDIGADHADAARRWRLAHALGPTLVASFANSPVRAGRRTGMRSTRHVLWAGLDPRRTGPAEMPSGAGDPAESWTRYALAARVMAVRRGDGEWTSDPGMTFAQWLGGETRYRRPDEADLRYHLTTLFPPVRPQGWYELRMIDAPPEAYWPVPIAIATALLDDAAAADTAACAVEPVAGRWRDAARTGLADPALARAARTCFAAARGALPRLGADPALLSRVDEYADRYIERGRSPADDPTTVAAQARPATARRRVPVATTRGDRPMPDGTDRVDHTEHEHAGHDHTDQARGHGHGHGDHEPAAGSRSVPSRSPGGGRSERAGGAGRPADPVRLAAVGEAGEQALKELIAAELTAVRRRSLGLTTDVLDDPALTSQVSPLMSPLIWDLAHIGNYEELWLLREAAGITPMRPEIDDLYDAFEHPRAERPSLPLLEPREATGYITTVRGKVLDSLDRVRFRPDDPLTAGAFVYGMVVQHEHQHDETMLATHQLRSGAAALAENGPALPAGFAPSRGSMPGAAGAGVRAGRPGSGPAPDVLIEAGPFTMGTADDPWAYDNERPAHVVDLPAYHIDTTPVTVAAYLAFMDAGGYDEQRWWSPGGWNWRCSGGPDGRPRHAPGFWFHTDGQWWRRRFGRVEPVPLDEPVQHVTWYEADAYARWAGKRLPTEAEWEKAARWGPGATRPRRYPWGDDPPEARHANLGQRRLRPAPAGAFPEGASAYGVEQLLGDVWEWTSSDLRGYPGFRAFPYREYSEVFFAADPGGSHRPHGGNAYKVLRGGSWATAPVAARNTFRNWDLPRRRQIFTGFRCARTPEWA